MQSGCGMSVGAGCDSACTFLAVLAPLDRALFLAGLTERDLSDVYVRRKILLSNWIQVMRSLKVSTTYVIYRHAYRGENSGSRKLSSKMTKYVVPMYHMLKEEPQLQSAMGEIVDLVGRSLYVGEAATVRILLKDDRLHVFETGDYTLSWWTNVDYMICDTMLH